MIKLKNLINESFEKIYNKFDKKDYFGTATLIKTQIGNWERALKDGDVGAKKYTAKSIEKIIKSNQRDLALANYKRIKTAIDKKDISYLKNILRYDQKYSKALFTDITGKELPKTTKQIHAVLDNFKNESINEGFKDDIMGVLRDHPDWSEADIASSLGVSTGVVLKVTNALTSRDRKKYGLSEGTTEKLMNGGMKTWWKFPKEDVMRFVYWTKRQIPPTDKAKFDKEWVSLKKQLVKKFPINEVMGYNLKARDKKIVNLFVNREFKEAQSQYKNSPYSIESKMGNGY